MAVPRFQDGLDITKPLEREDENEGKTMRFPVDSYELGNSLDRFDGLGVVR